MEMINVTVMRQPSRDEKPHPETYSVKRKDKMKVLDALNYINSLGPGLCIEQGSSR